MKSPIASENIEVRLQVCIGGPRVLSDSHATSCQRHANVMNRPHQAPHGIGTKRCLQTCVRIVERLPTGRNGPVTENKVVEGCCQPPQRARTVAGSSDLCDTSAAVGCLYEAVDKGEVGSTNRQRRLPFWGIRSVTLG
jgi:hypothetical protein